MNFKALIRQREAEAALRAHGGNLSHAAKSLELPGHGSIHSLLARHPELQHLVPAQKVRRKPIMRKELWHKEAL